MADILKLQELRRAYAQAWRDTDAYVATFGTFELATRANYHAVKLAEIDAHKAYLIELNAVEKVIPRNMQPDGFTWPTYRESCAARRSCGFNCDPWALWVEWQRFNGNLNPVEG